MSEPAPRRDLWAALLMALAVAVGLFAFWWQLRHPRAAWDGPILLGAALALSAAARSRLRPPRPAPTPQAQAARPTTGKRAAPFSLSLRDVSTWRLILFGLSLVLLGAMLDRIDVMNRADYTLEVGLWLAAMGLYILAVAPPVRRLREDWGLWWEINRPVVLVGALIFAVGAGVRLWALDSIPWTISGDEASHGIESVRVIRGEIRNPFATSWMGMPTMGFFYNSLGVRLFGESALGVRLPWSLFGIATILTTFWLVTRLRGLTVGLMTAALLAVMPLHVHFSRLGMNNTPDPFFITLALLFLYRARDRGSPLDWALAGLSTGLSFYFYPGARFTALLVALCIGALLWERRHDRAALRALLVGATILAGAFFMSAAPMLDYAARYPDEYNSRFNQVGIIQNGWLAEEPARRGTSTLNVLLDQLVRSALAFNVFPDTTTSFAPGGPLMQGLWAFFFLIGLIYVTLRLLIVRRDTRLFPLVIWWWGIILTGGMLTERPPASARLFGVAPVAAFFVAVAILRLTQLLQEGFWRRDRRVLAALLTVIITVVGAQGLHWYFGPVQARGNYGNRNGKLATALGYRLRAEPLAADQRLVFVAPPTMELKFSTIPFLIPEAAAEGINVWEPITEPPTNASLALAEDDRPLFVIGPWRAHELPLIEQGYPGGEVEVVTDEQGALFYLYEAP